MSIAVAFDQETLEAFCRASHIRRLAFFGSVLTDRFGPQSDVDVLVEFMPGQEPGLFSLAGMESELSEILGRKVDLRTPAELSPHFRDQVLADSVLQYAA